MKTVKEILIEAKILIENGWCQHSSAIDKTGTVVGINSANAIKFCALGAIARSCKQQELSATGILKIFSVIGIDYITEWNDESGRTKADVLEAFDKAIVLAEEYIVEVI